LRCCVSIAPAVHAQTDYRIGARMC
jgi:hypothetical protein